MISDWEASHMSRQTLVRDGCDGTGSHGGYLRKARRSGGWDGVRELSHWPITTAAAHIHDSDTPGRDT